MKRSMIIKRTAIAMTAVMMGFTFSGITAEAAGAKAGTAATVVNEAAQKGIDQYIINAIKGRAGATSPTGAKGIVHEQICILKTNATTNLFKNATTQYTKNSTAGTVDLVTLDKSGRVLERIQCKDTPGSIKKLMEQVKSGKYYSTQLWVTKETAELYKEAAPKYGVTKVAKDFGTSTKTTQRIADKALRMNPAKTMAKAAAKAGAAGAVIDGGIALVESIKNGDDFGYTVGNVSFCTVEGALSGATASLAGEAATAIIVATGATGAVTVLIPIAVTIGAGTVTYIVLENVDENCDIRGLIAEVANKAKDGTIQLADDAKFAIPEIVGDAKDQIYVLIDDAEEMVTEG